MLPVMAKPTNTRFALAVHVVTLLATDPDVLWGSDVLGGSADVSPEHVRRVLGGLRDAGLVISRPGPRGGTRLTRPADQITLAEVFDAVNGQDPVLGIHTASPQCVNGQAIHLELVRVEQQAAAALVAALARTTVADVAAASTARLYPAKAHAGTGQ